MRAETSCACHLVNLQPNILALAIGRAYYRRGIRVEWHKLALGRLGMKMRGFQPHLRERGLGPAELITAGHYEVSNEIDEGHSNRYCSSS